MYITTLIGPSFSSTVELAGYVACVRLICEHSPSKKDCENNCRGVISHGLVGGGCASVSSVYWGDGDEYLFGAKIMWLDMDGEYVDDVIGDNGEMWLTIN